EQLFDLALQLIAFPDFHGIRGFLQSSDPTLGPLDEGVHLLEAPPPTFEHPVEGLREFPERFLRLALLATGLEGRGGLSALLGGRIGRAFAADLHLLAA